MAEEESIFAKKPNAKTAEKSIFDKSTKKTTKPNKPKTGVIVAIVVSALAIIGGIVALVLVIVLNQPNYEEMSEALKKIEESSLENDISGSYFSYLPNGRFTKTSHDRYVKRAKDDLEKFRNHLKTIKEAASELEKAGAARSDVSKEYEDFKAKADDLLPKLDAAADDMDKYIEFSDRYYNSKLVVLDSYSSDYSSIKDLTDSTIDEIFKPLAETSSEQLRDFAKGMTEYIKYVVKFYSKYADYMDGTKTADDQIKSEVEKDTKELEKMTKEVDDFSDISGDDIFGFTQRDLTTFSEATKKLSDAVEKLL